MTKGAETRDRIIQSALQLLNQKGIAATSMSDLMAATDLEKGGIYRHFKGKDEIVEEALRAYVNVLSRRLQSALSNVDGYRNRVKTIVQILADIAEQPIVPGGCLLMNLAIETDFAGVGPRAVVVSAFKRWERLFRRELRAGIAAGEFRPELNVDDFTAVAISSIEGAIMLSALRPGLRPGPRVSRHLEAWLDAA